MWGNFIKEKRVKCENKNVKVTLHKYNSIKNFIKHFKIVEQITKKVSVQNDGLNAFRTCLKQKQILNIFCSRSFAGTSAPFELVFLKGNE